MVRITPQELDIIAKIAGKEREFDRPGIARAAGWGPDSAYAVFEIIKDRCVLPVGTGEGVRGQTVDLFVINPKVIPDCCPGCKFDQVLRFPCPIAQKKATDPLFFKGKTPVDATKE